MGNTEYNRRYYRENAEALREKERERRLANNDAVCARDRQLYAAQRDKKRAQARVRYEAHREAVKERRREWRRANPGKGSGSPPTRQQSRRAGDRRRARLRGVPYEPVDREAIYDRDHGRCHLCGGPVSRDGFTLDHIVPLSRGGAHTALNVALAHRSCNSSRGNRPLEEALLDRLLSLNVLTRMRESAAGGG